MFKFNLLLKISLTTLLLLPVILQVKSEKASSNLALPTQIKPTLIIQNQKEQKELRVALVIGNSQYKMSPLANPINDASDM